MSLKTPTSPSSPSRKRRGSGLTDTELWMIYEQIKRFKTDDSNEVDASDNAEMNFAQTPNLNTMIKYFESKLSADSELSFSAMTESHLEVFNIWQRGNLKLKSDLESLMATTEALGMTEHWSCEGLYQHLCKVQGLVPKANEASGRLWINAFFCRVATMGPPGKKMVLSAEQEVLAAVKPESLTFGGYVYYTAIMAPPDDAAQILRHPTFQNLTQHSEHTALFVSEAKSTSKELDKHIPHVICEMYVCAKGLGKPTIRGALTDGQIWTFFLLKINPDGNGAIYAESQKLRLLTLAPFPSMEQEVSRNMCTAISGIMASWIEHSNEDIGDDDWFTLEWRDMKV